MVYHADEILIAIKSPLYVAVYNSWDNGPISYHLFNQTAPQERISAYVDGSHLEIHKTNNMNSEYCESVSRLNKRGQQIENILFAKRLAAMTKHIECYAQSVDHLPHR